MPVLSASSVLIRTLEGQSLVLGSERMPELQVRVLMRLNGYTPLADLARDVEADELLAFAQDWIDAGLAEIHRAGTPAPASQWGELLEQRVV